MTNPSAQTSALPVPRHSLLREWKRDGDFLFCAYPCGILLCTANGSTTVFRFMALNVPLLCTCPCGASICLTDGNGTVFRSIALNVRQWCFSLLSVLARWPHHWLALNSPHFGNTRSGFKGEGKADSNKTIKPTATDEIPFGQDKANQNASAVDAVAE